MAFPEDDLNPNMDKPLYSKLTASPGAKEDLSPPMDIELSDNDPADQEGGMEIDLGEGDEMQPDSGAFDANLAETMPENAASSMVTELATLFESDKKGREEWEKVIARGMELLGFKSEDRTEPWPGASGVFHPVLAETAIQFQAHAIMELFPASGPARTTVFGEETEELLQKAARVEQEINFQITQKMSEYRMETEQLLYRLALTGSAFKKIYADPNLGRAVAMFVPAEEFIAPYGASDLGSCERYTHLMKRSTSEIKKLMRRGFYKEVEIDPPAPTFTQVREKIDKIVGERPAIEFNDKHDILEMHCDLDLSEYGYKDQYADEGIVAPYVVTFERQSNKILAVRRNWLETDQLRLKRTHFVHYQYLPGLGFYGTGLFHMIGGLAKSASSILRQLIDAGTLSNLPAGFKARGVRLKNSDEPIRPGEFRDVDVPGNSIRDGVLPLPIKEPSSVLFALLQNVVDEARRIGSVPDMDITDLQEGLPVGTTLAVLERSLKVMSAVQARMHSSLRVELGLIAAIIAELPGSYEYGVGDGYDRAADFQDRISIVPVSDPNAATTAQRVIQYQTVLQLASQQPMLYDMPKLHRTMLDYIGVKDAAKLVKMPDEQTPMDPVAENMAIITGKPVKAFLYQDHKAHITVHMAAAQDPSITSLVQQAPNAQAIMASMSAHILEHVAMDYRAGIEQSLGTQLPAEGEAIPPDVENKLSGLVAMAAQKLLGQNKALQAAQAAQQAAQDPMVQLQMQELAIKKQDSDTKKQQAATKIVTDTIKNKSDRELEELKIAAQLAVAGISSRDQNASNAANIVVDMAKTVHAADQADKQAQMGHQQGMEKQGAMHKQGMEKHGVQHNMDLHKADKAAGNTAQLEEMRAKMNPPKDKTE